MTLAEFKAWLEGYSASFTDGVPSAEQWQVISRKLQGVQAISLPVFSPYGPRAPDTMTHTLDVIRPYFVGDPPPVSISTTIAA